MTPGARPVRSPVGTHAPMPQLADRGCACAA